MPAFRQRCRAYDNSDREVRDVHQDRFGTSRADGDGMRSIIILTIVLAARVAAADSADATSTSSEEQPAVQPDQVSGIAVDDDDSSTLRDVGRVVLYPVRLGSTVAMAPLRGGAWLVERYQLRDRVQQWFVSDDGTEGIYPTAFVETGLGLNLGAHAFDTDLFGHGERQIAAVRAGHALPPVRIHVARAPSTHALRVIGIRR
jgi:hypothetical protein